MTNYVLNLLLNVPLNLSLATLNLLIYFMNYFILKLKKEYKGMHYKMVLTFLLPYFNIIFLFYNLFVLGMNSSRYRIVRLKKRNRKVTSIKA